MSGVVLLAAAAIALAWANSPWASAYEALWHLKLGLGAVEFLPARELHFWVNDGLMSIFFLVVGLEIRREMHEGALSDPRVATLPIVAAVGGVVVPALRRALRRSHLSTHHHRIRRTARNVTAMDSIPIIPRFYCLR